MNIQEARSYGKSELENSSPTAQLDADCILQEILGCDKAFLLFHRETELTREQKVHFVKATEKRLTGLPVAYITGHKEFYGRGFIVTPDVLIPKPDTEILVENALNFIKEKHSGNTSLSICDMCTGSGCVGLSILAECRDRDLCTPLPHMTLADISNDALKIAQKNISLLQLDSITPGIQIIHSNLFESVDGNFDIIVSNPPYIPRREAMQLLEDGRNEPLLALNGDVELDGNQSSTDDGLGIIRNLVPQAYTHLNQNGILAIETGEYNATGAAQIFRENGFKNVMIIKDLSDQDRNVIGEKE
ncbi:MAG: peptide chain release factor N(5)-glutamine methyltransferase [Treponema sp.]|nr:peptide chain release factor N(5)-glutamine methyltransferase [Treponema sp.]